MNPETFLIFDLDGTISDPAIGIGRSINYALAAYGYPKIAAHEVSQYVGPPLDIAFGQLTLSKSDEHVRDLVAKFRERYGEVGYAENVIYPGISEALRHLHSLGVPMGVCTSKRVDFAERILDLFQLREFFVFVSGGEVGIQKQGQLHALLAARTVDARSTMIGDRAIDVTAARVNGFRAVGVLWGHGTEQELVEALPDLVLQRPEQLTELANAVARVKTDED